MRRQASKVMIVLKAAGAIGMMLLASCLAFTLAYFLTRWYFAASGSQWTDLPKQLLTWVLGSLLLVAGSILIGLLTRPKQSAVWTEITEALRRIAKGDFNIRLDREQKYQGRFGDFVQTINDMANELQQMETLRQELISNVSHEIQSPLTSIRGFANTLQQDDLTPEERRQYLSIIEAESTRLSRLSDNLLKLTSLESEHQPFEPTSYRLDVQVRNVILASEPQWLEKSLDLDLDVPETVVCADEELMRQVWTNLVHNAIKFTPAGGSLQVTMEQTAEHVLVRITDTGIGIAQEDLPRVFERFYKGDKSRTRTVAGSGLGLAIVKKIVELHRGTVGVQSELGQGSTFAVRLPVGR